MKIKYLVLLFAMLLLSMSACSGGGGDGGSDHDDAPPDSTYTVTYNGNGSTGGSVPVDSTNYSSGQTVTVLGNTGTLAKTGYLFTGWNTQSNGSGTTYTQGQTFVMGSSNVTLYALWILESAVIGKWDESKWDEPEWGP
ncbi:MAG TPA: InlB B-repeat-containing protein [Smithella sp.]|nr:InlB B-repeat-containing protein [Smithella sp.]HNY49331.1 InlB B-repeat-containing protein [Smithella sp.]HOG89478.1 InlB B-repeat-containing protein [Smithella sp.]HOU50159.1 InlB B-repeat-containing protein [Smithella sp.]HQG64359.1 InlB B-repeat-containing protein [Smithella sp.]